MSKKAFITYTKGRQYKIKLRGKYISNGMISLFLDEYLGSKEEDGKLKTFRNIEYLKIFLIDSPKSPFDRIETRNNLILAENIRAKREEARLVKGTNLVGAHLKNINFIDYFQNHLDTYKNKDVRLVRACFTKFKEYADTEFLKPFEITSEYVREFKDYLVDNLNGDTPYNYFAKFKALCKKALKEKIFTDDPSDEIRVSRSEGIKKEILDFDEIEALAGAHCGNDEVKMAFLFCLNTGLRFVDVKGLTWKHISMNRKQMTKEQAKVQGSKNAFVTIDLNENAMAILRLREKGNPDELVFSLKTIESSNKVLGNWVKRAGIEKHITWHCARHSFATNLLFSNANIKTVSGLLGHSSLKHTEKYTHLVDELMRKAVDSLPQINLTETTK